MIEWIKNLRSTKRGRAAFKLFLYMIFLGFVLIIVGFGTAANNSKIKSSQSESKEDSNINSETEESSIELTYLEKQNKLISNNYKFTYTIMGLTEAVFEGEFKDGVVDGIKETDDMLIHYTIENGIIYKNNLKEKQEYTELYNKLDSRLFDFASLFEILNQASSIIEKNSTNKTYNYENINDYYIIVTTTPTEIIEINIKNENIEYNFKFQY